MDREISRRRFLLATTGATLGSVGLSGCLSTDEPIKPRVPKKAMRNNGWEHKEDIKDNITHTANINGVSQDISVKFHNTVWEKTPEVTQSEVKPPEELGTPKMVFTGGKGKTNPPVTVLLEKSDAPLKLVVDQVEPQIRSKLAARPNIQDVEKIEEDTIETHTGDTAKRFVYHLEYQYEQFTTTYKGQDVTVASGMFEIESQVAIWVHNGLIAAAVGMYPGQEGTLQVSAMGQQRDVSVGFTPKKYRKEMLRWLKSVD